MGYPCCPDMSTIPQRSRRRDRQPIFYHHVPVVRTLVEPTSIHLMLSMSRSWPQPVLLKQIEEGPLQVRVWNPKVYNIASSEPDRLLMHFPSFILQIDHIGCPSLLPHIPQCAQLTM
jgi:hypothetical protein